MKACLPRLLQQQRQQQTMLVMVFALVVGVSVNSYALEALDDSTLANTTGQDGLTVKIENDTGTIKLNRLRYIDADGFADNGQTSPAGLGINFDANNSVRLCGGTTASSGCATKNQLAKVVVDTEGGEGKPFLNASLTTYAKSLYLGINNISVLSGTTNTTTGRIELNTAAEKPIVKFSNGITVNMANPIMANLQLGNQPQGHMLLVNSNTLSSVDFGLVLLPSYITDGNNKSVENSQLSTQVKLTNVVVPASYADIDANNGLVFGMDGDLTVGSLAITGTTFGSIGKSNANIFNGLPNAAIGDITLKNIKVTDLNVSVKGM